MVGELLAQARPGGFRIGIAPVTQEMTLNYLAQNVMGLPRSY